MPSTNSATQEVLAVVADADVEDLDDVAVAQRRRHLGLGDEAARDGEAAVLAEVGQDALDRDRLPGRGGAGTPCRGRSPRRGRRRCARAARLRVTGARYHEPWPDQPTRPTRSSGARRRRARGRDRAGRVLGRRRRHRRPARRASGGAARRAPSPTLGPAIARATPFDLASLTKPMATAAIAMTLVSERRLALDDRAARWLPVDDAITVAHLLRPRRMRPAHRELFRRIWAGDLGGAADRAVGARHDGDDDAARARSGYGGDRTATSASSRAAGALLERAAGARRWPSSCAWSPRRSG
ncbi:MAG: serine hydrolase [Kofleriaceae bacterium]|nr:serine hydrolase [Kofleriaceae bacterium]